MQAAAKVAQFGHQEAEAFEAVGADGAVFDGEDWLRKFDVVDRKAADAAKRWHGDDRRRRLAEFSCLSRKIRLTRTLARPDVQEKLLDRGIDPLAKSGAELNTFVVAKKERWGRLIRRRRQARPASLGGRVRQDHA